MSLNESAKKHILLLGKILILVFLVGAAQLYGKLAVYLDPHGLFFIIVCGAAGAFMTFSGLEIMAALAHAAGAPGNAEDLHRSSLFWEAMARNFWILGVMQSIMSFVISLRNLSGGLPGITSHLADSLLAALYGMVLSVVCYVPCWKLERRHRCPSPSDGTASSVLAGRDKIRTWNFGHIVGFVLFVAILVSTVLQSPVAGIGAALGWIAYWPSLLVVFGGTLALMLFLGNAARPSALSPGFAVTGLIGSLFGFIQVLRGISAGSIAEISYALTFILSSCFAALLGMFLVGAPLEDRAAKGLGKNARTSLGRAAWYVFPLVALIFLVTVFLLIITPFERHQ